MATLDQQGNVLPDTPAVPTDQQLPELPEVTVTADLNWPKVFLLALAGAVVAHVLGLDEPAPRRRRR